MTASWSVATQKQYKSYLGRYLKFCQTNQINPMKPSVQDILKLFQLLSDEGKATSSISTMRALLDSFVVLDNRNLSKHKLIKRYLKGLSNINPPRARYADTWDPLPVLEGAADWGNVDELSFKDLQNRTLLLFILATGARMQTAYSLRTDDFKWDENGCSILLSERLKSHDPGTLSFRFNYLEEDINFCVASHLSFLLDREENLKARPYVFASLTRGIRPKQETLTRYFKETLEKLGIDTKRFKAHSARGASTSAAVRASANIDTVIKIVGWRKENNFQKFYNRPLYIQKETNLIRSFKKVK